MKNLTSKNIIIFGALSFLFISAGNALAYTSNSVDYNSFYDGNSHYSNDYIPNNEAPIPITLPNTPSTVKPAVSNVVASSNVKNNSATVTKTPASTSTTVKSSNKAVTSTDVNSASNTASNSSSIDANNLTALSFQGSSGFMPSSIWQWILVVILILAIVIIARILGNRPAGNDPHAVHVH